MWSPETEYEFVRHLGQGGMAMVELWRRKNFSQNLVVAKRVHVGDMTAAEEETARQEAKVLRKLKHPNIVGYVQSWVSHSSKDLIILQDYYEGGDLSDAIKKAGEARRPFPSSTVLRWLAQLTHALLYCHGTWHMLHRDLKPGNIFLSSDHNDVHLGDFGVAKALGSTKAFCNTFIGTCSYMSPEVIRLTEYGLKSDIWSLGTILYEVCMLRRPFSAGDPIKTMHLIVSPTPSPQLPPDSAYQPELRALCADMLIKNPEARPLLSELLAIQPLLREEVLRLEREINWPESLVPALDNNDAASQDPACGGDDEYANFRAQMLQEARISRSIGWPLSPIPASPEDTGRIPPPPPELPSNDCPEPPALPPLGSPTHGVPLPMTSQRVSHGTSVLDAIASRPASDGAPTDPAESKGVAEVQASEAVNAAAEVRGLLELTMRRHQLVAALEILEANQGAGAAQVPAPQVEPMQVAGQPPPGVAGVSGASAPELQHQASAVDARLRCLEVLQAECPDPEDLTIALRKIKELGLDFEECGQALRVHAHCLCLRAEDTLSRQDAELAEVERAAELLEAHAAAGVASPALPEAMSRLEEEREKTKLLGLRCLCDDCIRLLSVPRDAAFEELQRLVSEAWDRPTDSLHMTWRDGHADVQLEAEEEWQQCLQRHPRGPVQINLRPLTGAEASAARRWRRRHIAPRKDKTPGEARGKAASRARRERK